MAVPRKKNIAGFYDEFGRFRPIRTPSFVGTPKRKATPKDRKKYSKAKAGDLGPVKQELATGEDMFARMVRKDRETKQKIMSRIERETLGDSDTNDRGRSLVEFVRGQGGIKPGYKFGGKANRGKRISYDAGELAPLTYKESGKRGLVSDKGKKSLDNMFKAARESGYSVRDPWDLIDRMVAEINGGKVTYATTGYQDYRDNPKMKRNGVLIGDTDRKSDLYVSQLGSRSFGVFLKTYLLKKFSTKVLAEKHLASIKAKIRRNPKQNPVNIFGVVAGLSGVQSLLQIQEMMKKKKPVRRKAAAKRNPSGKTTAKAKNPHGEMPSGARFNEKLFDQDLAQIEDGNFRLIRSAKAHGRLAGYGPSEIDRLVQRARLAFQLKEMYKRKDNPANVAKLLAVPMKNNGAFKRMLGRRKAASALKRELKLEAALNKTREKKKKAIAAATNPHDLSKCPKCGKYAALNARNAAVCVTKACSNYGRFVKKQKRATANPTRSSVVRKAAARSANPKRPKRRVVQIGRTSTIRKPLGTDRSKARSGLLKLGYTAAQVREILGPVAEKRKKANPVSAKKPPRSRTFESFNGRPVTNGTHRPVSRHAPAKLAQLGDLIEIKLVGGHIITPNPAKVKLCAANGKLWIAGQKFAKANPASKANEINPLGEIDHVVYRTHKPHHGDAPDTHYIHKLGEETGHRPLLCVDREGFPVIRGGRYKIEARGIVN